MAERQPCSPAEDFDPLRDPFATLPDGPNRIYLPPETFEDDDHQDSLGSSCGNEQFNQLYSITPPINLRAVRREKGKLASCKREKDCSLEKMPSKTDEANDEVVPLIKEEYGRDDLKLTNLSTVDCENFHDCHDNDNVKERKRRDSKESKKTMTTNRSYDRFVKQNPEDIASNVTVDDLVVPLPVSDVTAMDRGRCWSLSSKQLRGRKSFHGTATSFSSVIHPAGKPRPMYSSCNQQCPTERLNFYKMFSTLISLGTNMKKEKEKAVPYKRQLSSEEEMWQTRLNDLIWLDLQAWHAGKSVDQQDEIVFVERQKVGSVLNEIMGFRMACDSLHTYSAVNSPQVEVPLIPVSSFNNFVVGSPISSYYASGLNIPPSPECSISSPAFHTVTLTPEQIHCQRHAIKKVKELLAKLEHCERLYPSCKAFAKSNDLYNSKEFSYRVEALCLWLNITRELRHKMKLLATVIGVDRMPGINWPWIDKDSCEGSPSFIPKSPSTGNFYLSKVSRQLQNANNSDNDSSEMDDSHFDVNNQSSPQTPLKVVIPKKVQFFTGSEKSSRCVTPVLLEESLSGTCTPTKLYPRPTSMSQSFATLSRASSELSLDENVKTSVYRYFVDKSLKKMGLQKLMLRMRDLLDRTLSRAMEALEKPKPMDSFSNYMHAESLTKKPVDETCISVSPNSPMSSTSTAVSTPLNSLHSSSLRHAISTSPEPQKHWSDEFMEIGLPSFRPSYLFLLRIPLDNVHECLRLRLDHKPIGDPSFLSIRQLIRECKEVLNGAVRLKQYYQIRVSAVIWEDENHETVEEQFAMDLEQFDTDLRKMLEVYFTYLHNWMTMLQTLPEASRSLKNALEQEWTFTKTISPHIIGGEAEAGKRFSTLASSLVSSIADFLESGIDECMTNWYDMTTELEDEEYKDDYDDEEEEMVSDEEYYDIGACGDASCASNSKDRNHEFKQSIQQACREFKNLFRESRERASKALGFAKMLRKDLEIAADFNINISIEDLLEKLKNTFHIRLIAPTSANYLMFIPEAIVSNKTLILQLLNVTCIGEDLASTETSLHDQGYLLMVSYDYGDAVDGSQLCPLWTGKNVQVEPSAETTICLSHIEVIGLLLIVTHSSQLAFQRSILERSMGSCLDLVNEQTSCHQQIADSLAELKAAALELRDKVVQSIYSVGEKLNFDDITDMDENKAHVVKLYRETMLQAYNFGFEYHKELTRLITGETKRKLGCGLINFAKDWMKFVTEKCERGRGMRPRWASQGFDFLTVTCEPKVMACLSEDEFQELKTSISKCISHVIGTAERGTPWGHNQNFRNAISSATTSNSSSCSDLASPRVLRNFSWPDSPDKVRRSLSTKSAQSEPTPNTTPNKSPDVHHINDTNSKTMSTSLTEVPIDEIDEPMFNDGHKKPRAMSADPILLPTPPMQLVNEAIYKLEESLHAKLREKRVIGRVTQKLGETDYHVSVRRVTFRWQRGIKIGEGQFGKVYTAVNIDTGDLMALKEIRLLGSRAGAGNGSGGHNVHMKFQPNDHKTLKEIADEIKIFEGIQHPNLVKYYGVEVHRDELLIFMEFCDRGTIEDAARLGLPEHMIRKYTRDTIRAITVIHERGIVHRDIKGANIFLTSSGCLKLGDFGCSVKLKNHTTMPGEINTLVGTTAYMAPEVITRNDQEGHGRAADIWSLGCVVIEMVTGKRPWHELENNYQIMFKVGMGGTPAIPDALSAEGKDFLNKCFETDPKERWTASELQDHAFTKVYDELEDDKDGMSSSHA